MIFTSMIFTSKIETPSPWRKYQSAPIRDGGTCQLAGVEWHLCAASSGSRLSGMDWARRTRRTEILVAWVVAGGVAAAGGYDFQQGAAPNGLFDLSADLRFVIFVGSCVLAAVLATVTLGTSSGPFRPYLRASTVVVGILAAVLADPTYSSLLLAVPLIDIRRRDTEPARSLWSAIVIGLVAWLLLSEDTPRVVAEVEAMFGLAIAFFIIVMFGDALRQLDRGVHVETEFAQLSERNRLTAELHDSVGHHLLASSVQLQKATAFRERDVAESFRAVEYASQAVAEAISETRLIVDAARHQRGFELPSAIRELTRRVVPGSTTITLNMAGDHDAIDPLAQIALYRVTQEALTNIIRHASASSAQITTLVTPQCITLEVVDDGSGFNPPVSHVEGGLENMRRRVENLGGSFAVTSSPGRTSVLATVPA